VPAESAAPCLQLRWCSPTTTSGYAWSIMNGGGRMERGGRPRGQVYMPVPACYLDQIDGIRFQQPHMLPPVFAGGYHLRPGPQRQRQRHCSRRSRLHQGGSCSCSGSPRLSPCVCQRRLTPTPRQPHRQWYGLTYRLQVGCSAGQAGHQTMVG
jgi:hypothetical protein